MLLSAAWVLALDRTAESAHRSQERARLEALARSAAMLVDGDGLGATDANLGATDANLGATDAKRVELRELLGALAAVLGVGRRRCRSDPPRHPPTGPRRGEEGVLSKIVNFRSFGLIDPRGTLGGELAHCGKQ